jgi:hypothetical protein
MVLGHARGTTKVLAPELFPGYTGERRIVETSVFPFVEFVRSTWPHPASDNQVSQKYWNPNGNNGGGAIWDWNYNVQRLSERPSYWKVADRFKR